MNIQESNKLIAEFMGIVYPKLDNVIVIDNVVTKEDELQYHTSWDWLMSVVEKIDAMFGEDDEVDDAINRVHNAMLSFDIDNTHKAVVEFINQYNKTK